jgi:hypothetical protein
MNSPNYISYKDTAARVIEKNGLYYRYIFTEYQREYDHLMQSGLYEKLNDKGLIIEHKELNESQRTNFEIDIVGNKDNVYCIIQPTQIAFQSYPFEWSYTQWQKAIISYLKINQIALQFGMILKDATPHNFYLNSGKAILLDTSSFSFFNEGDPWIAYRQFCSEFLSPIALMHYNGQKWSRITNVHLRGLPLNFVSKQLPYKSWFNTTVLLHIHMHAKYANAEGATNKKNDQKDKVNSTNGIQTKIEQKHYKGFSIEKLNYIFSTMLNTLTKWEKPYEFEKHWSTYYKKDIESEMYLENKEIIIKKWLERTQPNSVVDIGANTGRFSFIAANYSKRIIAIESDDICVDIMEAKIHKENSSNINVLMQELAETTPNLGVVEKEIKSIFTRAQSEMALALALEHHLHISNQISFSQIAEMFSLFSKRYLITEFVPANDEKVRILVKDRNVSLNEYTIENFTIALSKYYKIIEQTEIMGSKRTIMLLEKII